MDELRALRAFASVVEAGSFAEARRRVRVLDEMAAVREAVSGVDDRARARLRVRVTPWLAEVVASKD